LCDFIKYKVQKIDINIYFENITQIYI
jgi:hypothetical protein